MYLLFLMANQRPNMDGWQAKQWGTDWGLIYEELISKTSYIHSYMMLICRSGHSKKANFQHKMYYKWNMLEHA